MEVIKVENLYKQYRLGQVSTGSIAHDLNRWWHTARGKEDPYEKITGVNNREESGSNDYVWALQDINFSVKQGEVLGIIGRNGAGKSTLLKILSKVTSPTKGNIKVKGRIASLLEVGTGFHPELSGRENIFLNGAILGMTKSEIRSKFDEIVAFSGVEKYIDTPVKRYSSGMYVRLAFAVAAHLEPEILIVDEVLAVGDAEFQKKCLGKMKDASGEGRTVLFVSHNITAMKTLCERGIYLKNGEVALTSSIDEAVKNYLSLTSLSSFQEINKGNDKIFINAIHFKDNGVNGNFDIDKELNIYIQFEVRDKLHPVNINLFFKTSDQLIVFATCSKPEKMNKGIYEIVCNIPSSILNDIDYELDLMVVENGDKPIFFEEQILSIKGIEPNRTSAWLDKYPGLIRPEIFNWNLKLVK